MLASCGSVDGARDEVRAATAPPASQTKAMTGVSDTPIKIGMPFTVGTTTYTPVDSANYDEVGYASFYGIELSGKPTANGEMFVPSAVGAAHKTLPLPSYVEITALDTGRTILVRVNDHGPFANDRLIDLSEGAARQLGIMDKGVSGVRVRRVNPPEQERAVLRAGLPAAERLETPDSLLRILRDKLAKLPRPANLAVATTSAAAAVAIANTQAASANVSRSDRFIRESTGSRPAKAETPVRSAPASAGNYVVQLAAFSSRSRADQLARKLGANVRPTADGRLFRVRYGPYATEAEGKQGLVTAKAKGYPQARLYRD